MLSAPNVADQPSHRELSVIGAVRKRRTAALGVPQRDPQPDCGCGGVRRVCCACCGSRSRPLAIRLGHPAWRSRSPRTTPSGGVSSPADSASRVQPVGYETFVIDAVRIADAVPNGIGDAALVKVNQIGTVTEPPERFRSAATTVTRRWSCTGSHPTSVGSRNESGEVGALGPGNPWTPSAQEGIEVMVSVGLFRSPPSARA